MSVALSRVTWDNSLGEFKYLASPQPLTDDQGILPMGDPRLHGTSKQPVPPTAAASGPNPVTGENGGSDGIVDKIVEKVAS